jgi:hypothetical protein
MMRVTRLIFLSFIFVSALTTFSTVEAQNDQQTLVPGIATITASAIDTIPAWAVMERHVIKTMEENAQVYLDHFVKPDGTIYGGSSNQVAGAPNYDDLYEMFYAWGLFYAIGANEKILSNAIKEYNAITSMCSVYQPNNGYNLYNEFPEHADWFHISEGMMLFYSLGLADPSLLKNIERAKRFAGMYMNEDPEANNYDPEYKIIRGAVTGSKGASDSYDAVWHLTEGKASLYPIVANLEQTWYNNPTRKNEIQVLFNRIIVPCDGPGNLPATALVTNAYLYTGDEKYKKWVLEYVDAWMERIKENNGILPDNIGRTGKIGEYREGQWWGGFFGWSSIFSIHMIFGALTVAAECAYMLSGDSKYLDLLRSQIDILLDNSITTAEGQLLVPYGIDSNGWKNFRPMLIRDLSHLWHASMDPLDWQRIERLMNGNKYYPLPYSYSTSTEQWKKGAQFDWTVVPSWEDRDDDTRTEYSRIMYYAGKNPDWPLRILQADHDYALKMLAVVQSYSIPPSNLKQSDYLYHKSPVLTKGLLQVTMGAPQTIYNGGLLRARVRYFDSDLVRPGLPPDVAALVEGLESDRTVVRLVNLSDSTAHNLIIQAGAFGEHSFTEVKFFNNGFDNIVQLNSKYLGVELPPSTSILLDIGTQLCVNKPSYAFPWHGGTIPGTGIKDTPRKMFSVSQNSPNPFNPTTNISFTLPDAGMVSVEVYNITGQKVNTLVNEHMNAGNHSVIWDASGFSAGVYFYTVTFNNFTKTMKMAVVK